LLNGRLAAMAGFVEQGESVADIGADHGYLPLCLLREGVSPFAILTDAEPGPLERARESVERACGASSSMPPHVEQIDLRQGDGLKPLTEGEVDVVVIAGMGGETISGILMADMAKARSFRKYILQPRTKTDMLRGWLAGAGWTVLAEVAGEEKGRMCDIIVCQPDAVTMMDGVRDYD